MILWTSGPVTSNLTDFDAGNTAYYVQSDALGAYSNGVNGAASMLVANGHNHIVDGDWRLDLYNSTVRTIRVTFDSANAVQAGDRYTVRSAASNAKSRKRTSSRRSSGTLSI